MLRKDILPLFRTTTAYEQIKEAYSVLNSPAMRRSAIDKASRAAINNYFEQHLVEIPFMEDVHRMLESANDGVVMMFTWAETPEGQRYWDNISMRLAP